jgi:hypothetical protein
MELETIRVNGRTAFKRTRDDSVIAGVHFNLDSK